MPLMTFHPTNFNPSRPRDATLHACFTMQNSYSFYLFVQLRCVILPSELEYDRQFDVDQSLYDAYDKSAFSKQDKGEYACMIDFFDRYKKDTKFFLFGEDSCDIYHEIPDTDKAISKIKKSYNFAVFAYNPLTSSPNALLSAFDGWSGYTEITEKEYNKFNS
jgi:hypothetical protein